MVKSICCSYKGSQFSSQNWHDNSQQTDSSSKEIDSLLVSPSTRHAHGAQTYMQAKHITHIKFKKTLSQKVKTWPGVVMHTSNAFNPSTQEAEAGRSLSSRPARSIEQVPGQLGLHRETLSWG